MKGFYPANNIFRQILRRLGNERNFGILLNFTVPPIKGCDCGNDIHTSDKSFLKESPGNIFRLFVVLSCHIYKTMAHSAHFLTRVENGLVALSENGRSKYKKGWRPLIDKGSSLRIGVDGSREDQDTFNEAPDRADAAGDQGYKNLSDTEAGITQIKTVNPETTQKNA